MEHVRVNKVTTRFDGDGVMVATYYRTHKKLGAIQSDDPMVAQLGFKVPESTEEVEVTPKQKLDAFKEFAQVQAAAFGFTYDPVDRRDEANKFPNKYPDAELVLTTAQEVLSEKLTKVLEQIQKPLDKLIKDGLLAEGSEINCEIGEGTVEITESYKNGNIKYADALIPVTFEVNGLSKTIDITVKIVSGQLKKPRELGDYAFTMTGLKTALQDAGILPIPVKEDKEEVEETTEESAE